MTERNAPLPRPRADALDVARYLVETHGPMAQRMLQKLLYYCQAGSLGWTGVPMFGNRIEAWANGPVVVDLWNAHRYQSYIDRVNGGERALDSEARAIADSIWNAFGKFTPTQLSDMTHSEAPWWNARGTLPPGARGSVPISPEAMRDFYQRHWAN
jgi:uncharacterized phage-associated protein